MKSMKRPTLTILALVFCSLPAAYAAPPTPSAESSAAPGPSASARAASNGMSVSTYAWPKDASDKPNEDEWEHATELEEVKTSVRSWWGKIPATCLQRVVREWVRIECLPPDLMAENFRESRRFYGSLWGLAGDISSASGQFQLVSTLEPLAQDSDPNSVSGRLIRRMGAIATVTFQAKCGSAMMLRMDQILWADQYDGGGNVLLDPGIIIDVSWALGEKHPTIALNG
jgi:hypothetical protein